MTRRRRFRHSGTAKTLTVLAYAVLVTIVPVQHALQESVVGAQSIEASHSDECPTLHGGPACTVAALSLLAMPKAQAHLAGMARSHGTAPFETAWRFGASSILSTHRSRAPPPLK